MLTATKLGIGLGCGQPGCHCGKTAQTGTGTTHCPVPNHGKGRGDDGPSLSLSVVDGKTLLFCRAGCIQDAVVSVLKERGLWQEARPSRPERRRSEKPEAKPREWPAYDAVTGEEVSKHIRIDKRDGKKVVFWNPGGIAVADLALYRESVITGDDFKELVVVVSEGESATDSLADIEKSHGIIAVGTVTGAGVLPSDDALKILINRKVILWPDNDASGTHHMGMISSRLHVLGCKEIRIVQWTDAPAGGDAADAIAYGVDIGELLSNAQLWQPLTFNLSDLLERTSGMLRRCVVLNESQATGIALWIAHTHAFGAAEVTPYISINSAEKQSGKTRLLEVLQHMVAKKWFTGHVTASALVRTIAAKKPTLLLDETDAAFKGQKDYWEHVRGILNEGYSLGGLYSMSVPDGKDWTPRDFSVFCPKAFAGIGQLPDTVRDRSISIEMRRRAPNELIDNFRRRKSPLELKPIHDEFSAWATEAVPILIDAEPDLPGELSDRAMDVWEPLIAIADLAGEGWPERSRAAALALSAGANVEDASLGVTLLRDIKSLFDSQAVDAIPTDSFIAGDGRVAMGDLRGKELDNRRLAKELKPFGIKPKDIKVSTADNKVRKGYYREAFVDSWNRYLPTEATTATDDVPEPSQVALVAHVADKSGGAGGNAWQMAL